VLVAINIMPADSAEVICDKGLASAGEPVNVNNLGLCLKIKAVHTVVVNLSDSITIDFLVFEATELV